LINDTARGVKISYNFPPVGSLVHQFIGSLVPDGEESTSQNALRVAAKTPQRSGGSGFCTNNGSIF